MTWQCNIYTVGHRSVLSNDEHSLKAMGRNNLQSVTSLKQTMKGQFVTAKTIFQTIKIGTYSECGRSVIKLDCKRSQGTENNCLEESLRCGSVCSTAYCVIHIVRFDWRSSVTYMENLIKIYQQSTRYMLSNLNKPELAQYHSHTNKQTNTQKKAT